MRPEAQSTHTVCYHTHSSFHSQAYCAKRIQLFVNTLYQIPMAIIVLSFIVQWTILIETFVLFVISRLTKNPLILNIRLFFPLWFIAAELRYECHVNSEFGILHLELGKQLYTYFCFSGSNYAEPVQNLAERLLQCDTV